jgi:hypothetical protein
MIAAVGTCIMLFLILKRCWAWGGDEDLHLSLLGMIDAVPPPKK